MGKIEDLIDGRCGWAGHDAIYQAYHDHEWGRLVTDDRKLFEFIVLETAQAGLSWITILKKRDGYREAFCNFDVNRVSQMSDDDVERLMHFDGIVRNRLKIQSAISNARVFRTLQSEYGSFYNYIIKFLPDGKPIVNNPVTIADIPVTTEISDTISCDMRRRGFKFFGSTVCYAFLQAIGLVDDHLVGCKCKGNSKGLY